jgi:hypothetical protein
MTNDRLGQVKSRCRKDGSPGKNSYGKHILNAPKWFKVSPT